MTNAWFAVWMAAFVLIASGCAEQPSAPSSNTAPAPAATSQPADEAPYAAMGIMVGELTPESALVQVRLASTDRLVDGDVPGAEGVVEFSLKPADAGDTAAATTQLIEAKPERDFIARAHFTGLKPGTRYTCETRIGRDKDSLKAGPVATFQTLPGAEQSVPVAFVVVTGMNYAKFHGDNRIDRQLHVQQNNTELPPPYAGPDKDQGYPALATILRMKPNFFVGTGDNVYYDTPKNPRAETEKEMRQKWHEQFVQPRYLALFAQVPTYWEIDDHDYRKDDSDNSGDYEPSPELAKKIMLEQLPFAPADAADPKTYRTHRVSKDLQIWFTENRWYRSPNATPDGPDKTIWGPEQKEWLKRTLAESDATFKVLISPTPMVGPDDLRKTDNHSNVGGFQHERDEFFAWLKDSGVLAGHFYIVCGDRHWQYHSIHPTEVEEFACGALVDENSRPGRKPGDPKSTDPDALIKQPYLQDPPSGGFLLVRSTPAEGDTPAQLALEFYDEHGKLLHRETKTARGNTP
jgi:alkaline phosphatase D